MGPGGLLGAVRNLEGTGAIAVVVVVPGCLKWVTLVAVAKLCSARADKWGLNQGPNELGDLEYGLLVGEVVVLPLG